jgi:D-amino-acid dehydrogenase
MTKVVVIGGGVVGASAAFTLAQAGVETVLVDRKDKGHATAAGAGIISPGTNPRHSAAYLALAKASTTYYPRMLEELAAIGQTDTRYEAVGELLLAKSEQEADALPELETFINGQRDDGMPNIEQVTRVDDHAAREMFPALGPIEGALHVAGAGRVDGDYLRNALVAGATHHGAKVRAGSATIQTAGMKVTGIDLDGETIDADSVVIATGAWTNAMLEPLGVRVAVAPQRGQILHITMGDTDTSRWPILGGTGEQYMLTFGPNRIVSGATRETGSGFDVRLTVGGLQSVFNHAMRVAPGVAAGTVHEIRIGLRPLSADGLPFLGRIPGWDGVVLSTGHGPSGLQLGPYSGWVAAMLALGEAVDFDLTPYAVDRKVAATA